jgi:hypothetical protein
VECGWQSKVGREEQRLAERQELAKIRMLEKRKKAE